MVSKKQNVYTTFKILLYTTCTLGFVLNSFATFKKYFDNSTLVLTSQQRHDRLPVPVIVLCRPQAYKSHDRNITHESYINVTFDPWGIIDSIYAVVPTEQDSVDIGDKFEENGCGWEIQVINSIVRGRCIALHYKEEVFRGV